jgi:hypothetical protein
LYITLAFVHGRRGGRHRGGDCAKLSASSAGENRKPWNSSQPSACRNWPLRLGLHAFGDDLHAQRARHLQDGAHDGGVAVVVGQAADEAAVDLELVDREALQVGQAGIAGAEVVDGQPHAQARQRLQPRQRLVGVAHQDGLGQLQLQQVRRQAADGQHAGHAVDEVRLLELQRRDVDGDRHGVPRSCHSAAWRTACDSTQSPMATMKPVSSATGMNCAGETSPSSGSRQRISASAPTTCAARQVDLRLVVQAEAPLTRAWRMAWSSRMC